MFKWGEYLSLNDDLVNKGISTYTSAIDHYNKHGRFEDRCMSLNESDAHSLIKGKLIKNFDCIDTIIYTNETKFSVIITHFNRQEQLFNTLNSLLTYVSKYNFEVIIVDDGSDIPLTKKLFLSYNFPINIINIPKKTKTWVNPCIAYNKGIRASTGDIIILQNAEIIHVGNIFETVINNLTPQNYVVFSVFNSPNFNSNILFASNSDEKIKNFVKNTDYSMFAFNGEYYVRKYGLTHLSHWEALKHWNTIGKSKGLKCNESGIYCDFKMAVKWKGWLSHPTHNDRGFHFLSAISRKKMFEVGGFDEDFSNGIDYDDDDFVIRLSKLVSEIRIINPNNVFGVHQFHQKCAYSDNIQHKLKQKNKIIFEKKCKENKIPNINYIGDEYVEKTGVNQEKVYDISPVVSEVQTVVAESDVVNETQDIPVTTEVINERQSVTSTVLNGKKISIVMAFYNRRQQTLVTLDGFEKQYAGKYNFEVIIVDDNSNDENRFEKSTLKYNFPINLIYITKEEKGDRINPCSAYNIGFKEATGEIIIIQNPECYHVGNIIEYTLNNLKKQDYYSYSCFTANNEDITNEMLSHENINELIENNDFMTKNKNIIGLNWYNHPTEPNRNVGYHFCSALYKDKLDLIGGFDNKFAEGYCFDDDEFLLAIKHNLKLNIKIINTDECFVLHQFHKRNDSFNIDLNDDTCTIKIKWLKNKALLEEIKKYHETKKFNYPKLLYLYWDGSNMSYLNYLTVVSFNQYHKHWKIIIYTPEKKCDIIRWETNEQKTQYNENCYYKKLSEIENIQFKEICLDKIGFSNEISEVIKSDYFRYYILHEHGGLWSDFDIMYTACIEDKMNYEENCVIFRCKDYIDIENKKTSEYVNYYPVGLFLSKESSLFFKYLLENCEKYYSDKDYQCIGARMIKKLFSDDDDIYKIDNNIKICDEDYYLPWAWNEIDEFLIKKENKLPLNNVGIHWFNGADQSKKYAINLEKKMVSNNFEIKCYMDKFVNKYYKNKNALVTIIISMFNRKEQTIETLKQFNKLYSFKYNIEVILVDDKSNDNEKLFSEIYKFDFKIKHIQILKKDWINPVIPYNEAINNISEETEYVIIQNPEIYHCGDIIHNLINDVDINDHYLTYPVFLSPSFDYNEKIYKIENNYYENFVSKININDFDFDPIYYKNKYPELNKFNDDELYDHFVTHGLDNNLQCNDSNIFYRKNIVQDWKGWYNHYKYNPRNLHFLSCLKYDKLKKIGGFCNEFKDGLWYDDDDFLNRISKVLKIKTINSEEYFGIHQFHKSGSDDQHLDENFTNLVKKNKNIYEKIKIDNIIYCNPQHNIVKCIDTNEEFVTKNYKIGLCFKIFINNHASKNRLNIIQNFLKSLDMLIDNYDNLVIYGIIDCCATDDLKEIINNCNEKINIFNLNKNYGISFSTNIGIELLLEKNCDYIFCCDDDIVIKDSDILNIYIQNMINYKLHHLAYYPLDIFNTHTNNINNNIYSLNHAYSGCFYSLTKYIVLNKGYIPILDSKYGYEHEIFTKNITKIQYDIINSNKYLQLQSDSIKDCSGSKKDISNINKNILDLNLNLVPFENPLNYRKKISPPT